MRERRARTVESGRCRHLRFCAVCATKSSLDVRTKLTLGTETLYRDPGFMSDVSRIRSRLCSLEQRQCMPATFIFLEPCPSRVGANSTLDGQTELPRQARTRTRVEERKHAGPHIRPRRVQWRSTLPSLRRFYLHDRQCYHCGWRLHCLVKLPR